MNDQRLAKRSRHSGRHWLFTAMAIPLSPLMFGVAVQQNQAWHACVARHSLPVAPTQGPCAANYFWLGLTMVAVHLGQGLVRLVGSLKGPPVTGGWQIDAVSAY